MKKTPAVKSVRSSRKEIATRARAAGIKTAGPAKKLSNTMLRAKAAVLADAESLIAADRHLASAIDRAFESMQHQLATTVLYLNQPLD